MAGRDDFPVGIVRSPARARWRWYLMPFVPGMIVFLSAVSFAPDNPAPLEEA
ncbi:hypothetical protein [Hyphomonas sp.]|uniref:hypothetical protein n=1 Tax=Hyphomonas sp. TaxID=87 RepID=UPI0025BEEE4D|nr:hypothetical protein [Hyphomonas sp.]